MCTKHCHVCRRPSSASPLQRPLKPCLFLWSKYLCWTGAAQRLTWRCGLASMQIWHLYADLHPQAGFFWHQLSPCKC